MRLNPQAKYDRVEMRCADCKPSAHACCSEFIDLEKTVIKRLPVLSLHKPGDISADFFSLDCNAGKGISQPGAGIGAGLRLDMARTPGRVEQADGFMRFRCDAMCVP